MGRVEYGCHESKDKKQHIPFVAIEMPDGDVVTFTADVEFKTSKEAEAFCVFAQAVLAEGHAGNPTRTHHWGGKDSEILS